MLVFAGFATGLSLGFLVTLTSVGAGAVGAVMLAYLYPLRLTLSRLVATDIVNAEPLALCAGAGAYAGRKCWLCVAGLAAAGLCTRRVAGGYVFCPSASAVFAGCIGIGVGNHRV